jgi:hypothetical protein
MVARAWLLFLRRQLTTAARWRAQVLRAWRYREPSLGLSTEGPMGNLRVYSEVASMTDKCTVVAIPRISV